jgi:hypothetical protein
MARIGPFEPLADLELGARLEPPFLRKRTACGSWMALVVKGPRAAPR